MRERGLKLGKKGDHGGSPLHVAPHAGAWIETIGVVVVGANFRVSLPMRERGLKLDVPREDGVSVVVAPHAGVWIETTCRGNPLWLPSSLPMRERGLKQIPNRDLTSYVSAGTY